MSELTPPGNQEFGYLETIGRKSGLRRETEIWYATENGRILILSGYTSNKDWIKNFVAHPEVRFRIGEQWYAGVARLLKNDPDLDLRARRLLVAKHHGYDLDSGDPLPNDWSKDATVVVIEQLRLA